MISEFVAHIPLATRLSVRSLLRSPGYSATTTLILGVLFGPLVLVLTAAASLYVEPRRAMAYDELFAIGSYGRSMLSLPDFQSLQGMTQQPHVRFLAYRLIDGGLSTKQSITHVHIAYVTDGFFGITGAGLDRGRDLQASIDGDAVCIISANLWKQEYGEDPGIVGRLVDINGRRVTVVGVANARFRGVHVGEFIDVWMPVQHLASMEGESRTLEFRDARLFRVVARLTGPGDTAGLDSSLASAAKALAAQFPETDSRISLAAERLAEAPAEKQLERVLGLLTLATSIVLIAVALNLAALSLARTAAKARDLALMSMLGGHRWQLLTPIVLETTLLASAGVMLSLILTAGGAAVLHTQQVPLPQLLRPHWYVTLGAICGAGAVGALAGAALTMRITGQFATHFARPFARRSSGLLLGVVTVSQVAIAVAVFVVALGIVDGVKEAIAADPGFSTIDLFVSELDFSRTPIKELNAKVAHLDQLLADVGHRPDVMSAGLGISSLLNGWPPLRQPIQAPGSNGIRVPDAEFDQVGPRFFSTLQLGLLTGRDFSAQDFTGGIPRVVILSRSLARRLWPDGPAVGKMVMIRDRLSAEVIGVVSDAKMTDIRSASGPRFYLPILNNPNPRYYAYLRRRPNSRPPLQALRGAMQEAELDPTNPLEVSAVDESRRSALRPIALIGNSILCVAGIAMLIAFVGLYGTLSLELRARQKDIAIRMALGASPMRALSAVTVRLAYFVFAGVVLGCGIAVAFLGRLSLLTYGDSSINARVAIISLTSVFSVAIVASWFPLRRAFEVRLTDVLNSV